MRWLGFDWEEREFYASDYFEQLYEWAAQLVKAGKAYVCDLNAEEIVREHRGTLTTAGRGQPVPRSQRRGEPRALRAHAAGRVPGRLAHAAGEDRHGPSPNLNLRDPVIYRISARLPTRTRRQVVHLPDVRLGPRPGGLDRGITHSICTLEFENHRPLYDWCLDALEVYHPQQIEFARLEPDATR